MRARILRGAHEIGGSCIELEHEGDRLVLDVGRPLSAGWNDEIPLPNVPGLADGSDPRLRGVVLSHNHADHWGLVGQAHESVPRYVGQAGADILRAASFWGLGTDLRETGHLHDRTPFTLGAFTITPYLVDHSAYDAYALLVEAGGERLFYSGDVRAHGRKAALVRRLIDDPPGGVDVLLVEGTNVTGAGGAGMKPTDGESDVEDALVATLATRPGLVVVVGSAQNVDRLVTVYRATLRSDRNLVVDAYSADVARATGNANIPRPSPDWPRVQAYLTQRQRVRVKKAGEFERASALKPYRVFAETLASAPGSFVLYGSFASEVGSLIRSGALTDQGAVVWSLWDGYLADTGGQRLVTTCSDAGVPLLHHHTSGHASAEDLRALIDSLRPQRVVPIHTEHPRELLRLADSQADPVSDGEWWEVGNAVTRDRMGPL